MADLKRVYVAVDEPMALRKVEEFAGKRSGEHPKMAQFRQVNWPDLFTCFKYPQELRILIYITNSIEGFNCQLRKVTSYEI